MRKHWMIIWAPTILGALLYSAACAPERRYQVLSTLFDGVPLPQADEVRNAKKTPPKAPPPEPLPPLPDAVAPIEKPRPPIENIKTWEEALKMLPTDIMGGPDWVKAIKEGVIEPRSRFNGQTAADPPFTLDTFVPAVVSETTAALELNIEMVPPNAPFYKVVFPHSSHTLWLNCSSCHPGIVAQRSGGMQKIFAGEYCGTCHGKVSFEPMTSCARCHVNLPPASKEAIEADLAKVRESPLPATPELVERGKTAYLQACAVCHGEQGDGNGPLAAGLNPKPRNFTAGKFKLRSTSSSSIPTDYDLFRTITRGIPGTSMPSFSMLPYEDRVAMVQFLKTFSEVFAKEKPADPILIPDPPPPTPELLEEGKKLFKEAACNSCHGDNGMGDGPSAADLKDDWGNPIRPFDFTSGKSPKGGPTVKDYYRDVMTGLAQRDDRPTLKDYYRGVMTGLQGTPMPDFGEVFQPEQAWAVVQYVYSLGNAKRDAPAAVKGDIRFNRKTAGLDIAPPATFPHWFHRIRIRCAMCHPGVFKMKAGANAITMEDIREGKFCGRCHPSYPDKNSLAWPVTFQSCARCHVQQ